MHEKYGPVVRIGPNVLSLNYPELISTIYDTKGNYQKVSVVLSLIVIYILTWDRLDSMTEAVPL